MYIQHGMMLLFKPHGHIQAITSFFMVKSSRLKHILRKKKSQENNYLKRVLIRKIMAFSWKVCRQPILSTNDPLVNEFIIALANIDFTTHTKVKSKHLASTPPKNLDNVKKSKFFFVES
jgi:hypothetical protein